MVNKCRITKQSLTDMARERQNQIKRKWEPECTGGRNNKFRGPKRPLNKKVNITCTICGKDHVDRPCRVGLGICYICGLSDHYAEDCPQKKEQGPALRPQLQRRVFTLSGEEATQDSSLIQGKCLI